MSKINKQELREAAQKAAGAYDRLSIMPAGDIFDISQHEGTQLDADITALNAFNESANPAAVLALLDELEAAQSYVKERDEENQDLMLTVGRLRVEKEAAENRIAELEASHGNLREAMAGIHNTIAVGGAYTSLAAILNASKRAYEESANAAGIRINGEG